MTARVQARPARELSSGAWTARWGDWYIEVRHQLGGWRVRVYEWVQGRRGKLLAEMVRVAGAEEAVRWACTILALHGAKAIINGHHRPIIDYLAFTPAPVLAG